MSTVFSFPTATVSASLESAYPAGALISTTSYTPTGTLSNVTLPVFGIVRFSLPLTTTSKVSALPNTGANPSNSPFSPFTLNTAPPSVCRVSTSTLVMRSASISSCMATVAGAAEVLASVTVTITSSASAYPSAAVTSSILYVPGLICTTTALPSTVVNVVLPLASGTYTPSEAILSFSTFPSAPFKLNTQPSSAAPLSASTFLNSSASGMSCIAIRTGFAAPFSPLITNCRGLSLVYPSGALTSSTV